MNAGENIRLVVSAPEGGHGDWGIDTADGRIVAQGTPDALKQQTNSTTLEQAVLALTGSSIREESASGLDQMRGMARMWSRRGR